MHNNDTNPIIYQVFIGMCKILKEKEGIMHKEMAIDMGIGFSIFSKLLSGKRPITEIYEEKLYNYFNNPAFANYGPELTHYICESFHIPATSMLCRKMEAKNYEDLLHYLFFEFRLKDIGTEVDLKNLLMSYFHKFFVELLEKHPGESRGYQFIPDERFRTLEKHIGLATNCLLVLGQPAQQTWKEKVCILICPHGWNNEYELFSDPLLMDNFRNYMVVRLREKQARRICIIERHEKLPGSMAEFETIYIGRLCHNARQLAEIIFEKFCHDLKEEW